MSIEEKLINEVQQYPIIYDISNTFYYDTIRKENAWTEISENLNESIDVLKKKWASLRDCFRKALLKRKTKSGQEVKNFKSWKYEEQMSFLKAHFGVNRSQISNLPINDNQEETDGEDEDENGIIDCSKTREDILKKTTSQPFVAVDIEHNVKKSTDTTPKFKKQRTIIENLPSASQVLQTYLEDKKERKQKTLAVPDHLSSFFKAMEDTVRTFSPIHQVEAKSKIYALVSEYEYKNLSDKFGYPAQFSSPNSNITQGQSSSINSPQNQYEFPNNNNNTTIQHFLSSEIENYIQLN